MLLRNLIFAVLIGLIAAVIVNGAILLAVYNLPEAVLFPDANDPVIELVIVDAILLLGTLLATAPLIEWWYSHLNSWLGASWDDGGKEDETTS